MLGKAMLTIGCGAASVGVLGLTPTAHAAAVDGTPNGVYSSVDGSLVSVQTNVTTSPTDGGGSGGVSDEAQVGATNLTQISNAYASVDTANNVLHLFIGGSLNANDQGVSHYAIALQTKSGGVTSLNGQHLSGSVYEGNGNALGGENNQNDGTTNVTFDTGFKPNAFLFVDPNVGGYTGETDLTGTTAAGAGVAVNNGFTFGFDNTLGNTVIGRGATGDPGFAGAKTGLELSIDLSKLGYTGGNILATVFTTNGGNDSRTNNQVLSPFDYNAVDNSDGQVSPYDYTYLDGHEGNDPGRQFTGPAYPGNQYFTIAVPEPAGLGLLALAGVAGLRRSRKA